MIDPDKILAVCGFSRSGTTLTMRMLYAAGVPVQADDHISFEWAVADVTAVPERSAYWWQSCRGKAVKLLEPHRLDLPREADFHLLWCQRDLLHQALSQLKLLNRWMGLRPTRGDIIRTIRGIAEDTLHVRSALHLNWPKAKFLVLNFDETLAQPRQTAVGLCEWAGVEPTEPRLASMVRQVLPRGPECHPQMLEETFTEPVL